MKTLFGLILIVFTFSLAACTIDTAPPRTTSTTYTHYNTQTPTSTSTTVTRTN